MLVMTTARQITLLGNGCAAEEVWLILADHLISAKDSVTSGWCPTYQQWKFQNPSITPRLDISTKIDNLDRCEWILRRAAG